MQFMAVGLTSTYLPHYSLTGCLILDTWGSHQALLIASLVGAGVAQQ